VFVAVLALSLATARPVAAQDPPVLSASEVFKRASPAVVTIITRETQGSGVIVEGSGVIATNLHVIEGAARASILLASGDEYDDVEVVEFDQRRDLALLKIRGFNLPTATLGDSDGLAVGGKVYAIGAPKGLESTLSEGLISSVRDLGRGYRVLQTTAAVSPGSSGGGLFDDRGRLVGLTTFQRRDGQNLNFAVPINYLRGMLGSPSRMTLAQLTESMQPGRSSPREALDAQPNVAPRLAPLYRAAEGPLMVIEQDGSNVRVSLSSSGGYIYGSASLTWHADSRAFLGGGVLDSFCGVNRVWKAPVQVEIYVLNEKVIRERYAHPVRVNCNRQTVESHEWREIFWYVP
jgi:hypothetical protein